MLNYFSKRVQQYDALLLIEINYFSRFWSYENLIVSLAHSAFPLLPILIEWWSKSMFLSPSIKRTRYSSNGFQIVRFASPPIIIITETNKRVLIGSTFDTMKKYKPEMTGHFFCCRVYYCIVNRRIASCVAKICWIKSDELLFWNRCGYSLLEILLLDDLTLFDDLISVPSKVHNQTMFLVRCVYTAKNSLPSVILIKVDHLFCIFNMSNKPNILQLYPVVMNNWP